MQSSAADRSKSFGSLVVTHEAEKSLASPVTLAPAVGCPSLALSIEHALIVASDAELQRIVANWSQLSSAKQAEMLRIANGE